MKQKRKNKKSLKWLYVFILIIATVGISTVIKKPTDNVETTLKTYMSYILNKNYEKMYELISNKTKENIEKETYIARNKNIYEGIEVSDLQINIVQTTKKEEKTEIIYHVSIQTVAGEINFSNTSYLIEEEKDTYKLDWSSSDIFPELKEDYKVRVETIEAQRGKILDKNGSILAGKQAASSIGLVPRQNE